jgi:shikimate kinase
VAAKPEFGPVRTIVLVGFMAAGKTTVGRLLAQRLNWVFRDLDDEIEQRTGLAVAAFFRTHGEPSFRELERQIVAGWLTETETVLAPGGGWAANPESLAGLPQTAWSVWLRVSPAEAVRRSSVTGRTRPLLDVADPLDAARRLLAQREPLYARAHWNIDVDARTPESVAQEIEERYRENLKEWQQRKRTGSS